MSCRCPIVQKATSMSPSLRRLMGTSLCRVFRTHFPQMCREVQRRLLPRFLRASPLRRHLHSPCPHHRLQLRPQHPHPGNLSRCVSVGETTITVNTLLPSARRRRAMSTASAWLDTMSTGLTATTTESRASRYRSLGDCALRSRSPLPVWHHQTTYVYAPECLGTPGVLRDV